jgi:hypothetical protein
MSIEYKVPRILWENLESILMEHSRKFVKELAKRLDVPEKELMRQVLPNDKIQVTIMDSNQESLQCQAFIQQNKMTVYCRCPVVYQTNYCMAHRHKRMDVIPFSQKQIQRIKDDNIWVLSDSLILLNSNAEAIGKIYTNQNKIKRFIILDS